MLDLESLPLFLRQLLVIGDLEHQRPLFGPEVLLELPGVLGVFDRVVKNGSEERWEVSYPALCRQDGRYLDRMVDKGRFLDIPATLSAVLVGGKLQGGKELCQFRDAASNSLRSC